MKDIVKLLRNAETSVKWPDGSVDLVIHVAADEIERLREALLTAQAMLSEMGLPSAEKCQMAYDFLYDIARAALGEDRPFEDRWDNA
jgi:hypothetical protein